MSFENFLSSIPVEQKNEIIDMDNFLKSLRPLKFKRMVDKKKINYVSSDYGISYAIFPLASEPTQQFGWYYLHDKETKTWYRKTDYFVETLTEIAKTDSQLAERIFNAINKCKPCKDNPCSAIPYIYDGKQKSACYGRIVMRLCQDDFNHAKIFFQHLNALLEQKT
jgi:hypothetical protein